MSLRPSRLLPALAVCLLMPSAAAAATPKAAAPAPKVAANLPLGARLPLKIGARGHDVRVLQSYLKRAGEPTSVDGVFGNATKAAVVAFENLQRLTADGTLTAQDLTVLRNVITQGSAVATVSSVTGGAEMPTPQQIQAVAPGVKATVGPGGLAIAPAGAPPAVQAIIAAGNRIATLPYIYGGGHGASWDDTGYDCSGSVSFALHGGGLLSGPLTSGDFETWGDPGPGTWVTLYANGGHVYMVVAGLRFDTSGQSGAGTRWQTAMRPGTGYVVVHPPGL